MLYLSLAAFLAVFESWRITAFQAEKDNTSGVLAEEVSGEPRYQRYYRATLFALCVAGLALPIQYIFSDYGEVFLWGLCSISILAFGIWYWAGESQERLVHRNWIYWKLCFGFLTLVMIVSDTKVGYQPLERFEKAIDRWELLWIVMWILASASILLRFGKQVKDDLGDLIDRLFQSRLGAPLLVIFLSSLVALAIVFADGIRDKTDIIAIKADRACFVYMIYSFLAILVIAGRDTLMRIVHSFRAHLGGFRTTRIWTSLIIGLSVFLPAISRGVDPDIAALRALPFLLAAAGGFALNDYFDYARDAISKPHRAIPSGELSRKAVFWIAVFSLLGSVISATISIEDSWLYTLQISAVIGAVVYNFVVARLAIWKGIYTAGLCILPLIFNLVSIQLGRAYWLAVAGAYFFIVGRELLMDSLDFTGDLLTGIRTMAAHLGEFRCTVAGLSLCVGGALVLIVFALVEDVLSASVLVSIISISVGAFVGLWRLMPRPQKRWLLHFSWFPMLAALALFV